ncbi:terminase [Anaerocolumna sp. AGMB13025]|uniref:terminase n=1 Tax=Anaerocolumna sp. AGMB13025 TaxID=3039116 RepID=UPI00241DF427|nr:terminase [Anaerocolumna sp. AGMB13025]WFR56395.1 terminase [Anaerocolumna sp. AGMB13025]
MSQEQLILSDKYKAFIKHSAPVEFLEGTTAAGKTTVGIFKFMLLVAESKKKYHIIAAKDTGTAEKNIINKDLGIVDDFGILTEYNGNGTKDEKIPHILYHTSNGDKVVYVMGYGDKKKWQKALGGQYGCLYIDEINTADIDFVREAAMRCDYMMATLNPDDPSLPVYKEYINCSRPLPEYRADAPEEINNMLSEDPKPGWVHWFFSFADNLGMTPEKIAQIKLNVPKGTKLWKNKILGLRGRATGLIFSNFDRKRHVRSKEWAKQFIQKDRHQEEYFVIFTSGLDTSYSQESPDTIAMSFSGITNKGRYVLLDEKVYNNASLEIPIAPSDTVVNYIAFLERNRKEWGFAKNVFIDSADQATITEFMKYKRAHPECMYMFNGAYKAVEIIDRIILQLGWLSYDDEAGKEPVFYVVETCTVFISESEIYSWLEGKDNTPEDKNDHMINSTQYGWIPYRDKIGVVKK